MAIVEIAIRTIASRSGHTQPGDIIVAREPSMGIGRKEMHHFLWMWIEVDDVSAFLLTEASEQNKRRYHIPLAHLKDRVPKLDMTRATNPSTLYQPFIGADRSTGMRTSVPTAYRIGELVVDKLTRGLVHA